ncbi:MAG: M3 family oligoendopeptidase [Holosporales bacterium]|jgi:oligoendopeptidase F|nr:M3 family oligoendopeptidase [Holosporales bacterium]
MRTTWCLEDIYGSPDDCQLDIDLNTAGSLAEKFKISYSGRVSTENLYEAILEYEKIIGFLVRLESYAFLYLQINLNDDAALSFYRRIVEAIARIESQIVFFRIAISRLDEAALRKACSDDSSSELKKYESWLLDCCKYRDHMLLDETEEAMLQKQLTSNDSWVRLYDELLTRLEFPFDGETKRLPEILEIANHSADSETRENASRIISAKLDESAFYINHIYSSILLDRVTEDRLRKYDKPESFRHLANNIEQHVVDFLADSVVEQYENTSHKYYKLKARLLKKEKLEYWDRNVQVNRSGILEKKFEYRDAIQLVLGTFGSFSEIFREIANNFIENGWIDVYPRDGKTSGAFSHGCSPDVHPYILLNHFNGLRDVFTMIHELGHGIHQTLSGSNGPLLADTPVTLSEVASLFAENLLFEKILESSSTNDMEKVDILCFRLDNTINSVIRQIAFFRFERMAHEARRNGGSSIQSLSKMFIDTQRECLGSYVNVDDCISCYWCYISHFFHSPFYVYAYAFGEIFVNALFNSRRLMGEQFIEKYVRMLSRGGIDSYNIAASEFSLNPLRVEFWRDGVQSIADQVQYLEALCGRSVPD